MIGTSRRRRVLALAALLGAFGVTAPAAAEAVRPVAETGGEAGVYVTNWGARTLTISMLHAGSEHVLGRVSAHETRLFELPAWRGMGEVKLVARETGTRHERVVSEPFSPQLEVFRWEIPYPQRAMSQRATERGPRPSHLDLAWPF